MPTNQRGVAVLFKYLRAGNAVCILPDQIPNRRDRGCMAAPFFQQPALTMTLAHQLQRKTHCVILAATALRVGKGFALYFYTSPKAIYSGDALQSVTAMNTLIEHCVRRAPEQYQWEYRRFRGV